VTTASDERTAPSRPAGFVSRVTADLIDAVIVCVGAGIVLLVLSMLRALFGGSPPYLVRLGPLGRFAPLPLVLIVYLTVWWATIGRTPGKHVLGLRIVTRRDDGPGVIRSFARAVLCTIFPVGLLWVLVSGTDRAVHDLLVGTAVVYDWRPRRRSRRATEPSARPREGAVRVTFESSEPDDATVEIRSEDDGRPASSSRSLAATGAQSGRIRREEP
jgi:uncharacterized RDD family membrane protein YckC